MKKLIPCIGEHESNSLANARYIAHCNNLANIIASGMQRGANVKCNIDVKDAIDLYLQITQANVVDK